MIPLQACSVPKYTKSEYTITQIQLPLLLNSKYHHSADLWQTTAIFEPLPTSAVFVLPQAAPTLAYNAFVNDSICKQLGASRPVKHGFRVCCTPDALHEQARNSSQRLVRFAQLAFYCTTF